MSLIQAMRRFALLVVAGHAAALPLTACPAMAEEPPWSRPPAWLTTPNAARPASPEIGAVGLGAGVPRPVTTGSQSGSLIVGAESYTPPVMEYTGPSQHQAPYPAPLPTYSDGANTQVAHLLDSPTPVPPTMTYAAPTLAPSRPGAIPVQAAAKPLWEAGIIAAVDYTPDYPAAGDRSLHALPVPMIRYRGNILRIDDQGVHARALHTRNADISVGIGGLTPGSESKDNDARRGMPDLDWTAEVGPDVGWTIARAAHSAKVDLKVPVKAVVSSDLHSDVSYRGLLTQPELVYSHSNFLKSGIAISLGVSSAFASEDLQDYYYEVEAPYVTAARPGYEATAGYMGSSLTLSMATEITPWVGLSGYAQGGFLQGAANEDSPLYRDDMTYGVGMALSFTLAKSKTAGRD